MIGHAHESMPILPFRLLAADPHPCCDELMLALAREFREVEVDLALSQLDDLGRELSERRSDVPMRDALACRGRHRRRG